MEIPRSFGGNPGQSDHVTSATASLNLLLREDQLLKEHGLTESSTQLDKAFPYASALLEDKSRGISTKTRADNALQDVERKLALVESLSLKLSRTSPEAVAGHLLRLHGYSIQSKEGETDIAEEEKSSSTMTLTTLKDRSDRLQRQAEVLENVSRRVESSLIRGLVKMEATTTKLERVLALSSAVKTILRLQFENNKLQNYVLEDLRDLTRAAASVAAIEELLAQPELNMEPRIAVVEEIRPQTQQTAKAVRQAASKLLKEQYQQGNIQQLGATLQVYYHLGELSDAVWKAVDFAHSKAEEVSQNLWNHLTISNITERAKKSGKDNRDIQKKLKLGRTEAAEEWAAGVFDAATQVRNLTRVLARKSDPVLRKVFIDVVAESPIPASYGAFRADKEFSLFRVFWGRFCLTLTTVLESILSQDRGRYRADVAALYPAIRSVSKEMVESLQERLPSSSVDDAGSTPSAGILGGSLLLEDPFLGHGTGAARSSTDEVDLPVDTWSQSESVSATGGRSRGFTPHSASIMAAVLLSKEWMMLHGAKENPLGLYPLQDAFLVACSERLCAPLQYMFPENVTLDDDGIALSSTLALLPSKYDIQRFDENIRQELSLADPREGGGDLSTVTMIAGCVVRMISQFCAQAKNAVSCVGADGYLRDNFAMTESLQHDRKVVAILFTLGKYLRDAPEKTFIAPYRPATTVQHEEAALLCKEALKPATLEIDRGVEATVLRPLIQAIDGKLAVVLGRVHQGIYKDEDAPAFVQKDLSPLFEDFSDNLLAKFPPPYASKVAASVSAYTVYAFVSNATLVRPLEETARLHITQDVADLELILEQFVSKVSRKSLTQIQGGKPYAELRAVRQMLFWTGLSNKSLSAQEIAKSLIRELWVKDVRPSTILHYLFSFGPTLLSSPHHMKRMTMIEFVETLVHLDGSIDQGEDDAWQNTMQCCDMYQQRATSSASNVEGDDRVPGILLGIGPELLRRRQS